MLNVDVSGTDNSTNVSLSGTPDYITISGQVITRNQIDLTADVTGVLPSANLDADTAHLSTTQTFSGAKTFSSAVNITNNTDATNESTGALIVAGGVGIDDKLHVGDTITSDSRVLVNSTNSTSGRTFASEVSGNNFIDIRNTASGGGTILLGNVSTSGSYNCIFSREENNGTTNAREFRIIQSASGSSVNALIIDSSHNATFEGTVTGDNFITNSDRRLKSEIEPIKEGLEVIKKFSSYSYIKGGEKESGFIAQEVREAIPHTVYENNEGYLSMSDRGVLAHMHKAILELDKRLEAIEEKLK